MAEYGSEYAWIGLVVLIAVGGYFLYKNRRKIKDEAKDVMREHKGSQK